jgi:hypothetical protein
MKTNGTHEVIARIAGPGLVLAALLAMVLSGSSAGRAQSSSTSPAVPAATPAKAAPPAQAVHPAAPVKRQPGGTHEGVKVHGHWMIEVRSSDGKLISHTEFENSLTTTGTGVLNGFLLGSEVPGGYTVVLSNNGSEQSGPCPVVPLTGSTACDLVGSLISPLPAAFGDPFAQCGGTLWGSQVTAAGPCFPLSISGGGTAALTFKGTAVSSTTATYPASITDVYLNPTYCISYPGGVPAVGPGDAAVSPNTCAEGTQVGGPISQNLTHASLPVSGGATPCGGTGQVSCAVTVPAAGDSINVQVTISFQ